MDSGFEALLWFLQHQKRSQNYCDIAATALMMYDYALTLHLEVKLIWVQSPWNHVKILYLLTRYLTMVTIWLLLYIQLFPNVPENACAVIFPTTTWLTLIVLNLAEVILCVRTWAVYRQNTWVGIGLSLLLIGAFTSECYYLHEFPEVWSSVAPRPFPEFPGCLVVSTDGENVFWVCFIALSVVETVVLSLMVISAFRLYKSGNSSELSNVVHRDGTMFYVYLLVLTVTNAVTIEIAHYDMLILPQTVLSSILTTRIILNIRNVARQNQETVLDVTNPMVFGARGTRLEGSYWIQSTPEAGFESSIELQEHALVYS